LSQDVLSESHLSQDARVGATISQALSQGKPTFADRKSILVAGIAVQELHLEQERLQREFGVIALISQFLHAQQTGITLIQPTLEILQLGQFG
jgi:hypothetical protein